MTGDEVRPEVPSVVGVDDVDVDEGSAGLGWTLGWGRAGVVISAAAGYDRNGATSRGVSPRD